MRRRLRYPSAVSTANPKTRLRAFENILAMESQNGYQDRAVTGGLDRFLQTLSGDATLHPSLRRLADNGMLTVAYAELNSSRREAWVREAERLLGHTGVPSPAATRKPATPAKATTKPAPPAVTLDSPVTVLHSVNRTTAAKLAKLGVSTVRDVLYLFPNRHVDYSQRRTVSQLRTDEEQTVVVSLWEAHRVQLGRGGHLRATEAVVGDETGNIRVIWFGQPYMAQTLQRALAWAQQAGGAMGNDVRLVLSGKVTHFNGRRQMESPEWEAIEDPETADLIHTGRLVPVYPTIEGLHYQRTLRRIAREALDLVVPGPGHTPSLTFDDPLPAEVVERHGLLSLDRAIAQVHYPDSDDAYETARQRLAFDELFLLQLALAARKDAGKKQPKGITLRPVPAVLDGFLQTLPFKLTDGQRTSLDEALADVSKAAQPMSRLLQGDVGSGKTVVALALLLTAVANGYQGALMAPTEVLAEQHYLTVSRLLEGLSRPAQGANWFSVYLDGHPVPVSMGLLTGSTPAAARRELAQRLEDDSLDILIGTHALIQGDVKLPKLALAVVDEQHRFGVMQRSALRDKGREPHLLVMSATPIPRTLAMTVYGDLEVSTIPELPAGRQPIMTRYVPPERRDDAEAFIVRQVKGGRQAFVVCPLIEESEAVQSKAATVEYERLSTGPLAALRVGLLHGRMPLREKQAAMDAFRANELDVLVATPVIEVGIDVPNATVMLVEGADRFGLSQLHQLRGRVGRGAEQSYCLLLSAAASSDALSDARKRLDVLVKSNDGFEIAEADLRLRGPGDFFGTRQSGLPALRMARLDDRDILANARVEARQLVATDATLKAHPSLASAVHRYADAVSDEAA